MQKAELQFDIDVDPEQITVDETLIRVNGQCHGCSLRSILIQTNSSTFSCSRRGRRNSLCGFFRELRENSRCRTSRFSAMIRLISKLYSTDSTSDFECATVEIEPFSNVSLVRQNDEPFGSITRSRTHSYRPLNRGCKPSPSG